MNQLLTVQQHSRLGKEVLPETVRQFTPMFGNLEILCFGITLKSCTPVCLTMP
jgi:hypothetical protein